MSAPSSILRISSWSSSAALRPTFGFAPHQDLSLFIIWRGWVRELWLLPYRRGIHRRQARFYRVNNYRYRTFREITH